MDNNKLDRITLDMEKTKSKIAELQGRLRMLEQRKRELENAEIIALVRSEMVSDADLTEFLLSLRGGRGGSIHGNDVASPGKTASAADEAVSAVGEDASAVGKTAYTPGETAYAYGEITPAMTYAADGEGGNAICE